MISIWNLFIRKMTKVLILCSIVCIMVLACQEHSYKGLLDYISEHTDDFTKTATNHDIGISVSYTPIDIVAYRNYNPENADNIPFDSVKAAYQPMMFFDLNVHAGTSGISLLKKIQEHKEADLVKVYYNYQVLQDIRIVSGADTIPCTVFHRIQDGGINDKLSFICGFDRSMNYANKDIEFLYKDRIFSGEVFSLIFDYTKINQFPEIKK
jgi:hypothetical protein